MKSKSKEIMQLEKIAGRKLKEKFSEKDLESLIIEIYNNENISDSDRLTFEKITGIKITVKKGKE